MKGSLNFSYLGKFCLKRHCFFARRNAIPAIYEIPENAIQLLYLSQYSHQPKKGDYMKSMLMFFFTMLTVCLINAQGEEPEVIEWELNRLDTIGGFPVTLIGNPILIETGDGDAIEFDGAGDGLLVASNPLAGASEFTIEVIFKPYPGGLEEQRFVHMEQDDNNRALIELRSKPDEDWFLDTFIKSGTSSKALFAEGYPHASNEWSHACLVYKDNVMTHYVDGIEEMSGEVFFQEVSSGSTSLGVRQNLVSWYKGAIKTLRVTHKALSPDEFIINDTVTNPPTQTTENKNTALVTSTVFPNPVIDAASLSYTVEKTSRVIIKVYTNQLQLLAELVDDVQIPGNYTTTFNRNFLPSGLYFYSLQVNDAIAVEKFLVLDQ